MKKNLIEGVFDLMHCGHVFIVYNAKQVSDHLILGVNGDEHIAEYKGFDCIYTFEERSRLACALRFYDSFHGDIPYNVTVEDLEKIDCDKICHGSDITLNVYRDLANRNKLLVLPRTVGISSSALIFRLLQASLIVANEEAAVLTMLEDSDLVSEPSEILNYGKYLDPDTLKELQSHIDGLDTDGLTGDIGRTIKIPQQSTISYSMLKNIGPNRTRSDDDVAVYIDGAFDLIHSGHIDVLEQARELGTWTIVGLFDDASIRRMRGSAFPVISLIERAAVLLSMKYVDEVYFGTEWVLDKLFLSVIKPNIIMEREEMLTSTHTFAIRTRSEYSEDPYTYVKQMGIELVTPKMNVTISDIYMRVYNRREELQNMINTRLEKEASYSRKNTDCSI